eukprot:gb/GECH01012319.1/.p1 GENE.gb/GECH01012319.1/~~gb/GECH01012319.1/.p1  ORF type:complete len:627 (+),score=170.18 gb/GECH01012319.1/:1-1881(+)
MLPVTRQTPGRGDDNQDFVSFLIKKRNVVIISVFLVFFLFYFYFMLGAIDSPTTINQENEKQPVENNNNNNNYNRNPENKIIDNANAFNNDNNNHYKEDDPNNPHTDKDRPTDNQKPKADNDYATLVDENDEDEEEKQDKIGGIYPNEPGNDVQDIIDDAKADEKDEDADDNKNNQEQESTETQERREAVKQAFIHAWDAYESYAFGGDDLKPISKRPKNWVSEGMGLTLIDALDTMIIMDLTDRYTRARDWVAHQLDFNKGGGVSVFETNIRVVGGLLSAYDLSGDPMFLEKTKEIANKLLPAFETSSGIPKTTINLKTGNALVPKWLGGYCSLAEFGTLQLEFRHLSKLTGDPIYADKVNQVIDVIKSVEPEDGLYSVYLHPEKLRWRGPVSLGAMGDSFYEYLLKQWLQSGRKENDLRGMYDRSMQGVVDQLVQKSKEGLTYVAERNGNQLKHKMDHLACFTSGMLALGAEGDTYDEHMKIAEDLAYTCYQMYQSTKSKLSAEYVKFDNSRGMHLGPHRYYILRPETVESFFVLWRLTKNPKYRDWGWDVFQAIEDHCKVPSGGYSGVRDVDRVPVNLDDYQQSFFLAETLKYLYLLFSPDDSIPLDEYVFNTEAHPLRIWQN